MGKALPKTIFFNRKDTFDAAVRSPSIRPELQLWTLLQEAVSKPLDSALAGSDTPLLLLDKTINSLPMQTEASILSQLRFAYELVADIQAQAPHFIPREKLVTFSRFQRSHFENTFRHYCGTLDESRRSASITLGLLGAFTSDTAGGPASCARAGRPL
jgi:hypothetical protein